MIIVKSHFLQLRIKTIYFLLRLSTIALFLRVFVVLLYSFSIVTRRISGNNNLKNLFHNQGLTPFIQTKILQFL